MLQTPTSSIIKHPLVLTLIAVVIILGAGLFYSSPPSAQTSSPDSTYGHVHSLFQSPDGTLLMGAHNGLFRSVDTGKTFAKVDVKGDVSASDFMNFAYDLSTKTLFAGGHDLGVVKSTDGGVTWIKSDKGIKGTDIHALAINPLDTTKLYAFSVDNGVFGTKDGGKSWNRIDDGPANPSVRAFGYMGTPSSMDKGMKTDKTTNIGYLWAGTGGGLYSSFVCFCGWTKTTGISDNATINTLAPDPVNRSNMFAGTKDGIYQTTDEGKTFALINSDIKNIASITFDQTDPKTVFAVTDTGQLYKSDDNGSSWKKVN